MKDLMIWKNLHLSPLLLVPSEVPKLQEDLDAWSSVSLSQQLFVAASSQQLWVGSSDMIAERMPSKCQK